MMGVSWQKRAWAVVLALWGIGVMCVAPSRRHALAMGAFLLIAWLEACVPRALLFQPVRKTVEGYRRGTYPVRSTRDTLVAMGSFALMIAAILVPD
ncbi:hypothetical protein KPL74_09045 [Bacillus sp. NP157]|nr:hypothetical protein KPL74_09045 [Bacillus sp. NP157]